MGQKPIQKWVKMVIIGSKHDSRAWSLGDFVLRMWSSSYPPNLKRILALSTFGVLRAPPERKWKKWFYLAETWYDDRPHQQIDWSPKEISKISKTKELWAKTNPKWVKDGQNMSFELGVRAIVFLECCPLAAHRVWGESWHLSLFGVLRAPPEKKVKITSTWLKPGIMVDPINGIIDLKRISRVSLT